MLKFILLGVLIQQAIFLAVALATKEDKEKMIYAGIGFYALPLLLLRYIFKAFDISDRRSYNRLKVGNEIYYISHHNFKKIRNEVIQLMESGKVEVDMSEGVCIGKPAHKKVIKTFKEIKY